MSDIDVHGPIDFILLELQNDKMTGEVAAALADLVESGTIRLYDLAVLSKHADGTYSGLQLDAVGGFGVFAGAQSGLLGPDDQEEAASAMEPGTTAAMIVYENAWAIPFVAAARRAGGELVASMRIPAKDVMDTLEELEQTGV